MSNALASKSSTGWMVARVVSLLIAIALAAFLWINWEDDFSSLWAGDGPELPVLTNARTSAEPAKPLNVELQRCLNKRIGDVDRMKADGVINDAQYAQFRGRAEELCQAQNPA